MKHIVLLFIIFQINLVFAQTIKTKTELRSDDKKEITLITVEHFYENGDNKKTEYNYTNNARSSYVNYSEKKENVVIEETFDNEDKIVSIFVYEYDNNNDLINLEYSFSHNEKKYRENYESFYDGDNNLIKNIRHFNDGGSWVYFYEYKDGNKTKYTATYNGENSLEIEYKYENKLLVKETNYLFKNNERFITEEYYYYYNKKNRLVKEIQYYTNESPTLIKKYKYYKDGLVKSITSFKKNKLDMKKVFTYVFFDD